MKLKRFSNINEGDLSEKKIMGLDGRQWTTENGMGYAKAEETEDGGGYNITFEFQGSVRDVDLPGNDDNSNKLFLIKVANAMEKVMNSEFEDLQ